MKIIKILKKNCLRINEKKCKITCLSGTLWITYRNSKDILLLKNEEITLKHKKDTIIQGFENSSLTIETAIN